MSGRHEKGYFSCQNREENQPDNQGWGSSSNDHQSPVHVNGRTWHPIQVLSTGRYYACVPKIGPHLQSVTGPKFPRTGVDCRYCTAGPPSPSLPTTYYCTSCFSRAAGVMKTKLHCLQIGRDEDFVDSFCSEEEVSSTFSEFPTPSPSAPEVESLFCSPVEVTSLTPKEAFDVSSSLSTLGLSS